VKHLPLILLFLFSLRSNFDSAPRPPTSLTHFSSHTSSASFPLLPSGMVRYYWCYLLSLSRAWRSRVSSFVKRRPLRDRRLEVHPLFGFSSSASLLFRSPTQTTLPPVAFPRLPSSAGPDPRQRRGCRFLRFGSVPRSPIWRKICHSNPRRVF